MLYKERSMMVGGPYRRWRQIRGEVVRDRVIRSLVMDDGQWGAT